MVLLLGIIVGSLISLGVGYYLIRPKLKKVIQENKEIQVINELAEEKNKELENSVYFLSEKKTELKQQIAEYEINIKKYQEDLLTFDTLLEQQKEKESHALDKVKEECYKEYQQLLADQFESYDKTRKEYIGQLATIKADLDLEKTRAQAVAKAYFDERQEKQQINKIKLTEESLSDIKRLREIRPLVFEKENVSKIIWKGYFEKPLSKMLKHFYHNAEVSGIYKLTCGLTGEIYVGQAVNIADRFKQHVKKGLGIDYAKTKLYEAMLTHGVENFTFEILEVCSADKLNQEEKYWIDFYKSKEYGLNTLGGIK